MLIVIIISKSCTTNQRAGLLGEIILLERLVFGIQERYTRVYDYCWLVCTKIAHVYPVGIIFRIFYDAGY